MTAFIDSTPIPTVGDLGWGSVLNTALVSLDNRFAYSSGVYMPAGTKFYMLGSDRSGITTSATNFFGVSPSLTLGRSYLFEYFLLMSNSSTGAVTLGWAGTSVTQFQASATVVVNTGTGASTNITGVNVYSSTANAAITGAATAATHLIQIRGMVRDDGTGGAFPLQVSVASGTVTPKAGSWFHFQDVGANAGGTGNISLGSIV